MARSYAWMPLRDTFLEEEQEQWVLTVLIPELNKVSGLIWKLDQYMLHSEPTKLLIRDSDFDPIYNNMIESETIKKVLKRWPTIDEVGYKIIHMPVSGKPWRQDVKHKKINKIPCTEYDGFWAISTYPILRRGEIIGQKFGI